MKPQRRRKHKWALKFDTAFRLFHESCGWSGKFMATTIHWGAMVRWPRLHHNDCQLCHSIGLFFTVR